MRAVVSVDGCNARVRVLHAFAAATILFALASAAASPSAGAQTPDKPQAPAQPAASGEQVRLMSLPRSRIWLGDFDRMKKRRIVRILVPYSKTLFFQDKGVLRGVAAEAALEFEKWLNKRYPAKPYKFYVALIPTPRDKLLTELRAGKGDVVAANLTITPERSTLVDFSRPWIADVKELLITGPSAPEVTSLEDLSGQEIRVRVSSSYHASLVNLNKRLARPIKIVPNDENLEDEDVMEMVSAGLLPWAVVDSHKAKLWASILPNLTIRQDIVFRDNGSIAWAIRQKSPLLQKELDDFMAEVVGKAKMSDILFRYYKSGKPVKNALASKDREKFEQLIQHFRQYGGRFNIDPFLLTAQGYQESGFDQSMRMKSGAVGVMQIKPSTAREKQVNIGDVVSRAEDNIHAGAKYLRFLANKYISDPAVDEPNRVMMALAAYNAGPGNLRKFREQARQNGLDPNKWFGNVETGAAAVIGQETVQYVGNIYKYYLVYSTIMAKQNAPE
jgi:membrane-bound lytic murein transglycosylase MltF